jgi:hypothetical protein
MTRFTSFAFALVALTLSSCSTPPASYTVVSTTLSKHSSSDDFTKIFTLDRDLKGNGWLMRKGTQIAFGADGSAVLDTIVYAEDGLNLPNAIQLESIQYGADGNIQFAIPGNDVGHSLHMRHARRDYPYSFRFGYKRAYFPAIKQVKFSCRLLCEPTPPIIAPTGK